MFVGRVDEIASVREHLSAPQGAEGSSIVALYGLFGAGKTTLLRRIRAMVEDERLADAFFVTNEDINVHTLPEFVYHLATGFTSLDRDVSRFLPDETEARRRRYLQVVGRLNADTFPLLRELRQERMAPAHAERQEYGERQLEADMLALEVAVKNQFNNPDDQRLLLDTSNVITESLIVDLMNTFFPLDDATDSLDGHLAAGRAPKKIVVIIDTYEKITAILNPWLLESFLPYVYQKRFGDFQSYRTPYLPDNIYVRDFFDIRLVIAGRERLSLTDPERRWDRYRDVLNEVRVGPFSPQELDTYLKMNGFDPDKERARVADVTQRLPYLVSLWVDAAKADSDGAEQAFVNSLAEQRIFWYKSAEQQEWIRAAAFLDWFDADALRCFAPIGNQAQRAFEYLRNSSEVARSSPRKAGKFEVHEIIRVALRQSTFQESGDLALSLKESAEAFYEAYDLLGGFEPEERHLLRRLAYFAAFDEIAIDRFFGGEAHLVRNLIDRAGNLFIKNRFTRSLEPEVSRKLKRYNRCADREGYHESAELAHSVWEERRGDLEEQIDQWKGEINAAETRIRELQRDEKKTTELKAEARHSLQTLEGELLLTKRRWNQRLTARDALIARTSFFMMMLFLLVVLFGDAIPIEPGTLATIRTASLVMTVLFLGIFALMLGRILYNRGRRQEHQALREDVESIEKRLQDKQAYYHELGASTEGAHSEIGAAQGRIEELRRRIEEYRLLLAEPYV